MTTTRGLSQRLFSNPIFITTTAIVLRLAGLYFAYRFKPWMVVAPSTGGEVIQVAKSIASGRGFGNPLGTMNTGPTAWLCPVYPYIVAGAFRLAGNYTESSRLLLVSLNCILVGLTTWPIYAIARRSFGTTTAVFAAWLWVVLPVAWHVPIKLIWDSTLNALSLAVIFWATLAMRGRRESLLWAGYGALWAAGALINASILSLAPFFFAWLLWELHRKSLPWLKLLAVGVLLFALGLAPWTVRNYLVFGKFVLIRSNFGLLLWMGNHPGTYGFDQSLSPFANTGPAAVYKQMGEMAFMAEQKRKAYEFIASHPGRTMVLALRNARIFWITVNDRQANPWYGAPGFWNSHCISNAAFILCGLAGLFWAFQTRNPFAPLYLAVVLFFPLIYYLTRPGVRFRFAIEPELTVLVAYGALWVWHWMKERNLHSRDAAEQAQESPVYAER